MLEWWTFDRATRISLTLGIMSCQGQKLPAHSSDTGFESPILAHERPDKGLLLKVDATTSPAIRDSIDFGLGQLLSDARLNAQDSGKQTVDLSTGPVQIPKLDLGFGEPDARLNDEVDGGSITPMACPAQDFAGCGGQIEGRWHLIDFCGQDGPAGAERMCEGPGENVALCQSPPNMLQCQLLYGGRVDIQGDQATLRFGAGLSVRYVFDVLCLDALSGGANEAACAGMGNDRLACQKDQALCVCEAQRDPEDGEIMVVDVATNAEQISLAGAHGRYCVNADTLVIRFEPFGPQGWVSWLLRR